MELGNELQLKRWDTSNILTFFVFWSIQKDESNNEIIAGEKTKVIIIIKKQLQGEPIKTV